MRKNEMSMLISVAALAGVAFMVWKIRRDAEALKTVQAIAETAPTS